MFWIKQALTHSVRIFLGLLFIVSGLLKLMPVEPFELNFIELGVANWITAPIIARSIIGFELLLGAFLIFDLATKKFTIKATLILLIFFTAYLFFDLIKNGNNGNCGCFGTYLQMTPLQSVFKNIAMVAMLLIVYLIPTNYKLKDRSNLQDNTPLVQSETDTPQDLIIEANTVRNYRQGLVKIMIPVLIIASVAIPYFINTPDFIANGHRTGAVNYQLGLDKIVADSNAAQIPADLNKGRCIVAFMSLNCIHCRLSALKLHVMVQRHPEMPVFLVLHGKKDAEKSFFEFTKAGNLPFTYFNNDDFFSYVGGRVPAIFWVQNDTVKYRSTYSDLNENEIIHWLQTGITPVSADTSGTPK